MTRGTPTRKPSWSNSAEGSTDGYPPLLQGWLSADHQTLSRKPGMTSLSSWTKTGRPTKLSKPRTVLPSSLLKCHAPPPLGCSPGSLLSPQPASLTHDRPWETLSLWTSTLHAKPDPLLTPVADVVSSAIGPKIATACKGNPFPHRRPRSRNRRLSFSSAPAHLQPLNCFQSLRPLFSLFSRVIVSFIIVFIIVCILPIIVYYVY